MLAPGANTISFKAHDHTGLFSRYCWNVSYVRGTVLSVQHFKVEPSRAYPTINSVLQMKQPKRGGPVPSLGSYIVSVANLGRELSRFLSGQIHVCLCLFKSQTQSQGWLVTECTSPSGSNICFHEFVSLSVEQLMMSVSPACGI